MSVELFLRGLAIGFSIAAPVGPIGILCIRQTLAQGRLAGLLSGLGAATADAVYGALAALGLGLVSQFLIDQQQLLRLGGGLYLCYLAVRVWHAPVQIEHTSDEESHHGGRQSRLGGAAGAYFSTFFLTLTNPITILSFAAIFAGLGLVVAGPGTLRGAILVAGVFAGSAAWWLLLSSLVGFLRHRLRPDALRSINRVSALIILGFGCLALAGLVFLGGSP